MNQLNHHNRATLGWVKRMATNALLMTALVVVLVACGNKNSKPASADIPEGLALGNVTGSAGQTLDVPLTLKSEDPVLGMQFDVVWDTSLVTLGEPVMVANNQHMSVRTKLTEGRLRTLIFNTQSRPMDLTAGKILTLPVTIHSQMVGETPLQLTQVIVAGPNAKQIEVPIQFGRVHLTGSVTP